jgi:sporulation protein YlmC with PRC-barrel domain
MLASIALTAPTISQAQVAGSTLIGVSVTEMRDVSKGWSAKRQILGQPVFNDKDERVGSIDDIIVAPDKAVSYAIINAGGFLGLAKHDVAIPVSQLKLADNKLVLAGATKEALRNSPPFEYIRSRERSAAPRHDNKVRQLQADQVFATTYSTPGTLNPTTQIREELKCPAHKFSPTDRRHSSGSRCANSRKIGGCCCCAA